MPRGIVKTFFFCIIPKIYEYHINFAIIFVNLFPFLNKYDIMNMAMSMKPKTNPRLMARKGGSMKKMMIRAGAAALSALMTVFAAFPVGVSAYSGLGDVALISRDNIYHGLDYTSLVCFDASGRKQSAYILEYDPSRGGLPIISYGSTVYGRDRLSSMVDAALTDGQQVLGAINGDFYSMQTGVPLGVMISEGRLVSTDDAKKAVGFTKDNKVIIGSPDIHLTLRKPDGSEIEIDQLNKYPTIWGTYLLTDDFASTTLSSFEAREIVIDLMGGQITASGNIKCVIKDIVDGESNAPIPEGCAVLTIPETFEDYPLYDGLQTGDTVELITTCADGWNNVATAIGGGDMILENGIMPEGIIDEAHEKTANPRTAVGVKADGTVVFFANEGRLESGKGLTLSELSDVMRELGCVTALNLDGGGSTAVMVKNSWRDDCAYVSVPSDGSYRPVANGILLVGSYASDKNPAALSVIPNTPYVYIGSSVSLSAYPLDAAYVRCGEIISPEGLTLSFAEEYPDGAGSFSGGTFKAGHTVGEYRINAATSLWGGEINGQVSVIVTDEIDSLTVEPEYTKVASGSLTEINVSASYMGQTVLTDPSAIYFTLNGEHNVPDPADYPGAMIVCPLGYITTDGNFRSFGGREGEVEIGVMCGDLEKKILIRIGDASDVVADFEDPSEIGDFSLSAGNSVGMATFSVADSGYKSNGSVEISCDYQGGANERLFSLKPTKTVRVSPDAVSVRIWVSGDTPEKMTASLLDSSGNIHEIEYKVTKDYSRQLGWKQLTAEIPDNIKGGMLTLDTVISCVGSASGKLGMRIDDIEIYYGAAETTPLAGLENHWAKDYIASLYDMEVITAEDCEKTDSGLTWEPARTLSRGEFAKLLVRWRGVDASAYASNGIAIAGNVPEDQVKYIRAAVANGFMSGYGYSEDGALEFGAGDPLTREAAFKVLSTFLSSDGTALRFKDVSEIAEWAYDGISKCVAAGVVTGYDDNTLRPKATVSRAEIAALLSRMGQN